MDTMLRSSRSNLHVGKGSRAGSAGGNSVAFKRDTPCVCIQVKRASTSAEYEDFEPFVTSKRYCNRNCGHGLNPGTMGNGESYTMYCLGCTEGKAHGDSCDKGNLRLKMCRPCGTKMNPDKYAQKVLMKMLGSCKNDSDAAPHEGTNAWHASVLRMYKDHVVIKSAEGVCELFIKCDDLADNMHPQVDAIQYSAHDLRSEIETDPCTAECRAPKPYDGEMSLQADTQNGGHLLDIYAEGNHSGWSPCKEDTKSCCDLVNAVKRALSRSAPPIEKGPVVDPAPIAVCKQTETKNTASLPSGISAYQTPERPVPVPSGTIAFSTTVKPNEESSDSERLKSALRDSYAAIRGSSDRGTLRAFSECTFAQFKKVVNEISDELPTKAGDDILSESLDQRSITRFLDRLSEVHQSPCSMSDRGLCRRMNALHNCVCPCPWC